MKTGTPPRVDGRSLDWSKMELQPGDENPNKFSFTDTAPVQNQMPCHITYTNEKVHEILKTGFDQSPMFSGRIQGLGPRYCPSIEDKIDRFSDKNRHQLFVEPEGRNTCEIYVNGFSSSLPEDVQFKALRSIPGFENVKMFRPGYAIEYDFFPPTQLKISLETHAIENLYFAGQINGTTGYEEAACQGLMAGINAHLKLNEKEPFVLKRSDAYIGVLIDDLVNKGTNEPYRMFTSRAEYRILLRQDNADVRLTPLAQELGMMGADKRMVRVQEKINVANEIETFFNTYSADPVHFNAFLESIESSPMRQKTKLLSLLSRPHVGIENLRQCDPELELFLKDIEPEFVEFAEIKMKYEGYIQKEKELVEKMNRLEDFKINYQVDYHAISSLSMEARQKLSKTKPMTIGQASRISGVSPSDISILLVHLGR